MDVSVSSPDAPKVLRRKILKRPVAAVPSVIPAELPSVIPAEVPVGVPAEVPVGVPVGVPAEVPVGVPVGVPAEVPAGIPVIVRRVNEIASEILGDSFRPRENNLTIGKIVIPPELIAKWE